MEKDLMEEEARKLLGAKTTCCNGRAGVVVGYDSTGTGDRYVLMLSEGTNKNDQKYWESWGVKFLVDVPGEVQLHSHRANDFKVIHDAAVSSSRKDPDFPGVCPRCQSPAYVGLFDVICKKEGKL